MMHSLLLLMLLAQSSQVVAQRDPEKAAEQLAARDGFLERRLLNIVIDDPAMRTEIRRVGLARGCPVIYESRTEVAAAYQSTLVPITVAAIRKLVPAERLAQAPMLSFESASLLPFKLRVRGEVERSATDTLVAADQRMRRVFLERIQAEPAGDPRANRIMPRSDIAAALGLVGPYGLDKPSQLGMACAELLISPENRPTITTEPRR